MIGTDEQIKQIMQVTIRRASLAVLLVVPLALASGAPAIAEPYELEAGAVHPFGHGAPGASPGLMYADFSTAERPVPATVPEAGAPSVEPGPGVSVIPLPAGDAAPPPDGGEVPVRVPPRYGPELENLMQQFMSTGNDIQDRPGGEDKVPFETSAAGHPRLYEVLAATTESNPLLTEQCRKEAAQFSVDALQQSLGLRSDDAALREAVAHIQQHLDDMKSRMGDQVSYSAYLKVISNCRTFCAPLVAKLVQCHVLSVAGNDHGIVLFGFNRHDVTAPFKGPNGVITSVAKRLHEAAGKQLLVIGRASRVGDLRYNRRLSGLRAFAVKDELVNAGVPAERIQTTWFGWEPPQINTSIADQYGLRDLLDREGELQMNQSVVMVLYEPADY